MGAAAQPDLPVRGDELREDGDEAGRQFIIVETAQPSQAKERATSSAVVVGRSASDRPISLVS
jgi:hypothetical protein